MNNKSRLHTVAVFLIAAVASVATRGDTVDDYVRSQMERQHIPGVTLAVIRDGKPIKVRGYGLANIELGTPARPDTVYRIGSVSKQFIAAAIVLLANEGKLSLQDPPAKYLEGAPEAWRDITIRHLLTHTSGLVREAPGFDALKVQRDADVIASAYAAPLVFKPGERWQYSNLGYFMLAEIVAKASGQPWPEFVAQRIFVPLGMEASRTVDPTPIVPNRAAGYAYSNGELKNAAALLALRPSGAFMSSARDLIKWDAALDRAALLPKESLDAMWTAATLTDGTSARYGYGWISDQLGSRREVAHGGTTPGFRSYYLRLPDDRLSVILLANNEFAAVDAMAAGIASRYVKDLFPPRKRVQLTTAELDALTGQYQFRLGGPVRVTRHEAGLRMQASVGLDFLLLPQAPTTFYSDDDPRLLFVFRPGKDPGVTEVAVMNGDVEQNGGPRQAAP